MQFQKNIKFQCNYSVTIEHSVVVSVTERNSIVLHTRMGGIGTIVIKALRRDVATGEPPPSNRLGDA
jgi:hypothetical protein